MTNNIPSTPAQVSTLDMLPPEFSKPLQNLRAAMLDPHIPQTILNRWLPSAAERENIELQNKMRRAVGREMIGAIGMAIDTRLAVLKQLLEGQMQVSGARMVAMVSGQLIALLHSTDATIRQRFRAICDDVDQEINEVLMWPETKTSKKLQLERLYKTLERASVTADYLISEFEVSIRQKLSAST